jgi:hypothetical protein
MTAGSVAPQWRVEFDAEVVFSNGGALQTQGFRLDIPGDDIADAQLGELLIRHLGLLMVGEVRITRKKLIQEPHKGSRGVASTDAARRVVDLGAATLGGPDLALGELVDLPGVVIRVTGAGSAVVDRPTLAAFHLTGHAVVLQGDGGAFLTPAAATWLVAAEVALVATDATNAGPAGMILRQAGIPLLEGVSGLALLPPNSFRLHAVPFPPAAATVRLARVYAVCDPHNSRKDPAS